ncbi:unnamed protein product [Polarella glacialis]|uniref:EF-hand domain-containing protein n=1 Tax=Polarella glacialis TaxID=89957 RepID=A0A813I8H4_POLGL|nr:unnamed protein product [Polarella glacialis]
MKVLVRPVWSKETLAIPVVSAEECTVAELTEAVSEQLQVPRRAQLLSRGTRRLELEERDEQTGEFLRHRRLAEFLLEPEEEVEVHLVDFSSLRPPGASSEAPVCNIPKTEERGITIRQIRLVFEFVKLCSSSSGWTVAWKDSNPMSPFHGQPMHIDSFNLYQACEWIIKPSTSEDRCSFVELMASQRELQLPSWFASHWWGEPIKKFVHCLEEHIRVRGLSLDLAYWVCAYCNNQHSITGEMNTNPRASSFFKAMHSCDGLLLVVDEASVALTRVWCAFELATVLLGHVKSKRQGRRFLLDIATAQPWTEVSKKHGFRSEETHDAVLITDGMSMAERQEECFRAGSGHVRQAMRESKFPIEIIEKAMEIDIEAAQASMQADRNRILNCIAGSNFSNFDSDPPAHHHSYERCNHHIRSMFAQAAFSLAAMHDDPGYFHRIVKALSDNPEEKCLSLTCATSKVLSDEHVPGLVACMNPGLKILDVNLHSCRAVTCQGLGQLMQSLPKSLRTLVLTLVNLLSVNQASASALAESMPQNLQVLKLKFDFCPLLTSKSLGQIARRLPSSLRTLWFSAARCKLVDDSAIHQLAENLPERLEVLKLNFRTCIITDVAASHLLRNLPRLQLLHDFQFDIRATCVSSDMVQRLRSTSLAPCPKKMEMGLDLDFAAQSSKIAGASALRHTFACWSAILSPSFTECVRHSNEDCESDDQGADLEFTSDLLAESLRNKISESISDVSAAFRKWDTNNDGQLSIEELTHLVRALGIPTKHIGALFQEIDTSGDGFICYEELISWLFRS